MKICMVILIPPLVIMLIANNCFKSRGRTGGIISSSGNLLLMLWSKINVEMIRFEMFTELS